VNKNKEKFDDEIKINIYFLYLCAMLKKNSRQIDLLIKKRRNKNI
jgi:hypothetical protein